MELLEFAFVAALFFVFSLISKRLDGSFLTAPILFTAAGYIAGQTFLGHLSLTFSDSIIHTVAEITLILVLAADASAISLKSLSSSKTLPIRLLAIGLPLVILLGTAIGYLIFPDKGWLFAALLASILAPTDAALGASIVANTAIPERVRQGLNVESGLNDGIALPAVLFFGCFFNVSHQSNDVNWIAFLAEQLTLGPIAGIIAGYVGGMLIGWAAKRDCITSSMQGVAALSLAVLAFACAEMVGGNGFIAAFVCGLTYGNLKTSHAHFFHEFTETESQLLTQLTFFLFGLAILPQAIDNASLQTLLYAAASLTIVRMLPVAVSQIGSGLKLPTVAFLGWFGPRGLASLLFALLVIEDLGMQNAETVQSIVSITVALSIVLHGVSAGFLGRSYAGWAQKNTTARCQENKLTRGAAHGHNDG